MDQSDSGSISAVTVAVLVLWSARVESGPVARRWPAPTGDRLLSKRSPSIDDRPGCSEGAAAPPNRVNTTQRLADLRRQLTLYDVDAYIVTSDNAHQVCHPVRLPLKDAVPACTIVFTIVFYKGL